MSLTEEERKAIVELKIEKAKEIPLIEPAEKLIDTIVSLIQ